MKSQIAMDRAGRIVLPKAVRDKLHLSAGDLLEISVEAEEVKLHPIRSQGRMVKEGSFWVYDAGSPIDPKEVDDFVRFLRNSREAKIAGGSD